MGKSKHTSKNYENETEKESSTTEECLDNYINNSNISLSNLEKVGAFLLSLGYSLFLIGAALDIAETLETNNTGVSPSDVFLYGEQLILIGYIILWGVASNRVNLEIFISNNTDENVFLSPYNKVAFSYALSVVANAIRLEGFAELDYINNNSESSTTERHKHH